MLERKSDDLWLVTGCAYRVYQEIVQLLRTRRHPNQIYKQNVQRFLKHDDRPLKRDHHYDTLCVSS